MASRSPTDERRGLATRDPLGDSDLPAVCEDAVSFASGVRDALGLGRYPPPDRGEVHARLDPIERVHHAPPDLPYAAEGIIGR